MSKKKITSKQKRKKKVKEKKNSSFTRGNLQTKGNNVQTRLWQKKKKKTSPCASAWARREPRTGQAHVQVHVFLSFAYQTHLI